MGLGTRHEVVRHARLDAMRPWQLHPSMIALTWVFYLVFNKDYNIITIILTTDLLTLLTEESKGLTDGLREEEETH